MKNLLLCFVCFFLYTVQSFAQGNQINIDSSDSGLKLIVDGKPFMINGMNWDYFPIGTNYSYSLWTQSDEFIKKALDDEMSLLKNMGVNTIRVYTGIQPKWIEYIYDNYGIYTMLNHSFGRYGLTINGQWVPNTEYSDPRTQNLLMSEVTAMVTEYQNTRGLLIYLLGNENNYGLFWEGAETEDIPIEDRKSTQRAEAMYQVMNYAVKSMKQIDSNHPIAICNGDLLFLDIIARECPDVDIYGTNMYRGASFGDAFDRVKNEYGKPILFTEFGSDAFDAMNNEEDQGAQAHYMVQNWSEIYQNAAGLGKAGNSIGGFTFQFSDGWWKYKQTSNLETHDTNASWSNGGYLFDYKEGQNNMNEEWFGICAKGPTNTQGFYTLYPRAAYYALQNAHLLNPYNDVASYNEVAGYFASIKIVDAELRARGDKAIATGGSSNLIRISNLAAKFETYNTGGHLLTTPGSADLDNVVYPNKTGFDHMQSYFIGVEGNPTNNMRAELNFNILGNVAGNPIDQIFYENRGRQQIIETDNGQITLSDPERIALYNAEYEWNSKAADVRGFYRTGHYHWGYEGDFFGLYPEANYGPNLDIYNGQILGMEVDAKGKLDGLKAAFGPQLWWGANPAFLVKYRKNIKSYNVTGIFHKDVDKAGAAVSSIAIPLPQTTRATLQVEKEIGNFGFQVGGMWGGQPLNGRSFQYVKQGPSGNYIVYDDKIKSTDNWGGKAKLTYSMGPFNWYGTFASMGLVANGGYDQTQTYTGWRLKDNGSGNQNSFLTGITYTTGDFQIAPNFLWQKPLVGAIPNDIGGPARLRNVQDDPFAVRINRETIAGEILLTYDPTPGSWFYQWDNDRAEDAKLAMNLGFVYRHLPTTMDAAIVFLSDARVGTPLSNSVPAEDLWEINTRIVSKQNPNFGIIANLFTGNGQANGDNDRLIHRVGGDIRMIYNKWKLESAAKFNDWGPYDYHRDFNLTFPTQLMADLSTSLERPDWYVLPSTKIGLRGTWRSLDEYSPRYTPTYVPPNTYPPVPPLSNVGFGNGSEWEIRTYIHINIGK